jgi:hypothetical protein
LAGRRIVPVNWVIPPGWVNEGIETVSETDSPIHPKRG